MSKLAYRMVLVARAFGRERLAGLGVAAVFASSLAVAGCGIDRAGLSPTDASVATGGSGGRSAGTGGSVGEGGQPGTGGESGTGGVIGSGGMVGTGGALGSGGARGEAGRGGAGAAVGTGGAPRTDGSGGGTPGTGGMAGRGSGGAGGAGAVAGTGGRGTGGAIATGGRGTGGAATGGEDSGGANAGGAGAGGRSGGGGVGGVAPPRCSPSSCPDGCCARDRCVTQTSAQQCGTAGATCVACGGCQLCGSDGACAIDPASRWTIVCDSAQLSAMPPFPGPWDLPGELGNRNPDPFCEFETVAGVVSDSGAAATSTVMDSFTATWNETVTPPGVTISGATLLSPTAPWRIWVGDDDGCDNTGCFGDVACEIDAPMQAAWLESGGFTLMNLASCVSVSVTLVCQP